MALLGLKIGLHSAPVGSVWGVPCAEEVLLFLGAHFAIVEAVTVHLEAEIELDSDRLAQGLL